MTGNVEVMTFEECRAKRDDALQRLGMTLAEFQAAYYEDPCCPPGDHDYRAWGEATTWDWMMGGEP